MGLVRVGVEFYVVPEKKLEVEFMKICQFEGFLPDLEKDEIPGNFTKDVIIGTVEGLDDVYPGTENEALLEVEVDIDAITLFIQSTSKDPQEEDIFYFEPFYISRHNLSEPKIFGLDPTRDYISDAPRDFLIVFNCIGEGKDELEVKIPLDDFEMIEFKIYKDCQPELPSAQNSVTNSKGFFDEIGNDRRC